MQRPRTSIEGRPSQLEAIPSLKFTSTLTTYRIWPVRADRGFTHHHRFDLLTAGYGLHLHKERLPLKPTMSNGAKNDRPSTVSCESSVEKTTDNKLNRTTDDWCEMTPIKRCGMSLITLILNRKNSTSWRSRLYNCLGKQDLRESATEHSACRA